MEISTTDSATLRGTSALLTSHKLSVQTILARKLMVSNQLRRRDINMKSSTLPRLPEIPYFPFSLCLLKRIENSLQSVRNPKSLCVELFLPVVKAETFNLKYTRKQQKTKRWATCGFTNCCQISSAVHSQQRAASTRLSENTSIDCQTSVSLH